MKVLAFLLCLLAGPALAQTGSIKTPTALTTEINTLLADNTANQITAFDFRQVFLDVITSAASLSVANTFTAGLTVNPGAGITPGSTINQSFSGGSLPTGNAGNLIFITGDNAQAGVGFLDGFAITDFVGGSAMTGGRQGFASFLNLTAPTNASNANRNYVGVWGNAFSAAGDGGTNTGAGALGALFGSGAWGDLQSGATNMLNVSASEYNVSIRTGASAKHKTIIQAVQHSLDAVPGATTDAAIVVSSQGVPATGLTDGLLFSDMAGAQGVKTAGSLIRSTGGTFANGVDFSASTLTAAFKSNGFNVDGGGNITGLGLVSTGQIRSTFGVPTIASGACGATTNGTISGTNQSGVITIGAAATTVCTISFSITLLNAPGACVVFPGNATAAATGTTVARVGTPSTTQWALTGSVLANTVYSYICL